MTHVVGRSNRKSRCYDQIEWEKTTATGRAASTGANPVSV